MSFTNITNTTESLPDYNDLNDANRVSYQVLRIVQIVNNVILSGALCLVGMVVNIINMIIFVQHGLDNTSNIGMFAISLSDWCSLVTLEWHNINYNPFMVEADVPFDPAGVQFLTADYPHSCFQQITIWLTVCVTTERFLCIAFPLEVQQIVTPFRAKVIVTCIYLLMFISVSPLYVLFYLGENLNMWRKETRVVLKEREVGVNLKVLYMMGVVKRIVLFITLTILTCMLVIALKRMSDWRKGSKINGKMSKNVPTREVKSMKIVSLIAGTLLIFTAPTVIFGFVEVQLLFQPEFVIDNYVLDTCWSFAFLSEAISSNVNIFFFYKMSSNFRHQFQELFAKCRCFWQRGGVTGRGQ